MVGVATGFALPQAVSRRPKPAVSASSFACFPAKPWPCSRSRPRPRPRPRAAARLVVSARYSSSYGDYDDEEVDEDEEFGGGRGGGWGRRDRRADADYDPALDIDRIESSTVRLLDEQKRMVGVVSVNEAIQIADDRDLILAILSVDGDPPVLRLFEEKEYKKHKYEQQKKKRIQQKRSVANRMSLKELKMGYNIDIHDYTVRLKAAKKFLKAGDKVKIIVNLKGRENLYKNTAIELIKRFQKDLGELATEESKNFMERNIYVVLVPNKVAIQKEQTELNKKESVTEDRLEEGGASLMDQQEGTEPVTEQLEENKNSATEVSANI